MSWRQLIVGLNSLGVGDLVAIRRKIDQAREQMRSRGQEELADRLGEAADALERGEMTEYRRLLSLVVSRLGHLRG